MSATTTCLSDSGRNAAAAPCSMAPRSNGPLLTGSWSAPAREPSSSCSTSLPSDPARSAMVRTAARLSVSASWSHRLCSVLANPCTTVMGVRSSWLVVARNRSFASSSSLAAVTSRKSMTSSPLSASEVHRTSSQRPFGSLWVSVEPGSGSGNDGGLPMASWAGVPVIRCAAGFHCRTRPTASSTAMPSALPSMTARSWARCLTTSSNAIALVRATPACPASSSSSSSSTWLSLRLL